MESDRDVACYFLRQSSHYRLNFIGLVNLVNGATRTLALLPDDAAAAAATAATAALLR